MEILKFENAPAPRKSASKKSNLKSLAGLATVAAVAVLGSTLAANISLGTGSALEFGQGVQTTSACDSSITLSPKVTFQNSATTPQFMLSTISFTDVDAQAGACRGDVLTLNAYGNSAATPLQIATNGSTAVSEARIYINSTSPTSLTGGVVTTTATNQGAANAAFDVAFTTPSATSGAVYKLTLQSSNN
jgi:hypothetical protein